MHIEIIYTLTGLRIIIHKRHTYTTKTYTCTTHTCVNNVFIDITTVTESAYDSKIDYKRKTHQFAPYRLWKQEVNSL